MGSPVVRRPNCPTTTAATSRTTATRSSSASTTGSTCRGTWTSPPTARHTATPRTTVAGQSGGAAKVLTLMGMPSAKGLFHKAVVASGQAACRSQSDVRAQTAAVFGELGVTAVEQLKQVPHRTLLAASGRRGSPRAR
ncbi:carboxylesterase family protein [Lentzea sp. HUAS TT2]|uniref:carboxylesterase family protein n=1 Tax=Lentzea sp. HUAS TT2 TaxID=3447454 RepID=UPI003F72B51B